MAKYHPKSNKGVFSKKQKKSSRTMMMMRRGFTPQQSNGDMAIGSEFHGDSSIGNGLVTAFVGAVMAMKMRFSRGRG